jgi:adenylyl-sulfate kinase
MKSGVLWLTGLSGAGKSTIANNIAARLHQKCDHPVILDGDVMRTIFKQYSFDEQSRKEYNLFIGKLASILEQNNRFVVVALISPYREIRSEIKKLCKRFIEVHVSTDIETCKSRDPKGLYKKALAGEIDNFTGITAPYEIPLQPELVLNTALHSEKETTNMLLAYLKTHDFI